VTNRNDAPGDQATNKAAAQAILNDPAQRKSIGGIPVLRGRYRILDTMGPSLAQLGTTFLAQLNSNSRETELKKETSDSPDPDCCRDCRSLSSVNQVARK